MTTRAPTRKDYQVSTFCFIQHNEDGMGLDSSISEGASLVLTSPHMPK